MKNKKTIVIHARLDKATYLKVKKLAELYKVSLSTMLRLLIDVGLGGKMPQPLLKPIEPTERKNTLEK